MSRRELDEWFWQVGSELQRLSDEMFRSGPPLTSRRFWEPKIDLLEDASNFLIKAEVAGVRGEDIQLLYVEERHSILLRGVRREEEYPAATRTGIYQLEIYYGDFEREIKLPEIPVEPDGMRAQYRNGFLLIIVPKLVESQKGMDVKEV
jgi:HSP20 family protein